MLDVSPKNLMEEVLKAIEVRREVTDESQKQIQLFAGNRYMNSWLSEIKGDVNHPFELYTNLMPRLVYNNPKVKFKSRRPRAQRELVQGMEHGSNRWIRDVDFKGKSRRVAADMLFDFGVMVTSLEPLPGHEHKASPPLRPSLVRISPRRYFRDHKGGIDGPRFEGHVWTKDKNDMAKSKNADGTPMYDKQVLDQLSERDESSDFRADDIIGRAGTDNGPSRNQVIGYEVYSHETKTIYTLAQDHVRGKPNDAVFLRPPRKAFGPSSGPYVVFGMFEVPDQVYPLSPLAATAEQVEELNAHRAQTRRQAEVSRRLLLVNAQNRELAEAVKMFKDGTIAEIAQFNKEDFAEVSLGGPDEGQLAYTSLLREELQITSGLSDARRGGTQGQTTATEINEMSQGEDARMSFMQDRFKEAVTKVLSNAAWFMFMSQNVVFPVPSAKADRMVGEFQKGADDETQEDGVFLGGIQPGQEDFTFEDLELEIEPYTMEMVDQAVLQRRYQQAFDIVTQSLPMMRQYPEANWPELLDDLFESLNIPDGRKYINWAKLEEMIQMQFEAGDPKQVPGLDGAPPVDTNSFMRHPGMPADDAQQGDGPKNVGGAGKTHELAAILGEGQSEFAA